ncbi:MAG: ABC transporter permease subunit [Oscillospiraceae bacterium]|nr:ABC transporter permease subunit [Oscillospiraceae bacterium]
MRLLELKRDWRMNKGLYFLIIPVVIYLIIFNYVPMAGIVLGFERFTPKNGVYMSEWVGLKHFTTFFSSVFFIRVLKNTMILSLYSVIFGFPAPILFALLLNELDNEYFKKVIQVVSYMPNFISTVVISGIILDFVASDGVITDLLVKIGFLTEGKNLMSVPEYFRTIMVVTDLWQQVGFGSILFLAALTGIDQELYEAAVIDGANRWKQTIHVTIPGIMPTVVIMLIMRIGGLMNANQEKILLLYNPLIYETSDVIGTFVYRKGLLEADYGYSTAVGLFNSVVNVVLLFVANGVSRKYSETSLF